MDIFIIDIRTAENIDFELLKTFQKKEISNQKKLLEHCFSYFSVARILNDFYEINNREIILKKRKPFLEFGEKFFSISHSNDFIVLCFSNYDCGIDVEKIKKRDFIEIAKRMGFSSSTLDDFYKEWTTFEAEYKLGKSAQSCKGFYHKGSFITAVSENLQEEFEIYIQNGEKFSKINT